MFEAGDVVKASNRRGRFSLRSECANGDGWWAIEEKSKRVVPVRPAKVVLKAGGKK